VLAVQPRGGFEDVLPVLRGLGFRDFHVRCPMIVVVIKTRL
jgi:hypothetical protein